MLKETINKNRNGFEKFDIGHLSASSVNKAREAFDVWIVDKLGGAKFPTHFAMWQGKAVELGSDQGLYSGKVMDFCIRSALDYFSKQTHLLPNYAEEYAKREPIISRMVQTAIQQLRTIGVPKQPTLGEQHKIEIPVRFAEGDNGTIPCIGFLDYWFPEENIIEKGKLGPGQIIAIDLKKGKLFKDKELKDFLAKDYKKYSKQIIDLEKKNNKITNDEINELSLIHI